MPPALDKTLETNSARETGPRTHTPQNLPGASTTCPLCDLAPGETAVVHDSSWLAENSALLESYGFFSGSTVTRVGSAPQGDPLIFRLERRLVAVRRETAAGILVVRENT